MSSENDFDANWYIRRYPDVAHSGIDPLDHYARHGRDEGRFPNASAEVQMGAAYQVDSDWYARRYPDVAQSGINPIDHYVRHGRNEGRLPNAAAEVKTVSADEVDAAWYIQRYPDVAESNIDPVYHYVNYGFKEGRSPNWHAERPEYWLRWFDPVWYAARYKDLGHYIDDPLEHYLRIGIMEGRAPYAALDCRESWIDTFDARWYAERYPDVVHSNQDPLEHFILVGLPTNRKPNGRCKSSYKEVTEAKLDCVRAGPIGEDVVLFVTHCPEGAIKPHVIWHLRSLKALGLSIILIAAGGQRAAIDLSEACDFVDVCFIRSNQGYDFAAWAHIFRTTHVLYEKRSVILINDSIIGPFSIKGLAIILNKIENSKCDLVGLTDNYQLGWHLQSYFIAIKGSALKSTAFRAFIEGVKSFASKEEVIYEYETRFTARMTSAGLFCEAIFKSRDLTNYTAFRWRELIDKGMPYIKVGVLCKSITSVDVNGWREAVAERGFETFLADRSLAIVAANAAPNKSLVDRKIAYVQRDAITNMYQFFATGGNLRFRSDRCPEIRYLIVVRNQAEWLYSCLRLLTKFAGPEATITVFNNGSSDDTAYLLSRTSGIDIIESASAMDIFDVIRNSAVEKGANRLLVLDCGFVVKLFELRKLIKILCSYRNSFSWPKRCFLYSNEYYAKLLRRVIPDLSHDAIDQELNGILYIPNRIHQEQILCCSSLNEYLVSLVAAGMGIESLSPRQEDV